MAPYDSDSSGAEDDDFTETNVLLGYPSREAGDDTISQIGGRPEWLNPATPPSAVLARCKVCNDHMVLLLQLNGDLPETFPGHERRLYVFACRRKTCRRKEGSVRALRGVRMTEVTKESRKEKHQAEPESQAVKPSVNIGNALFGAPSASGSAPRNPFSTGSLSSVSNPFSTTGVSTNSNPFSDSRSPEAAAPKQNSPGIDLPKTFASALSLNNDQLKQGPPPPPEPWPEDSRLPKPYPLYYLADADYEILDKIEDPPIPAQTMDLDDEAGGNGGSQKEDKMVYESTIDKTFQKFADRLAQNPEQVIRYEFKGLPLLYSKKDPVGKMFAGDQGKEKLQTTNGSGNKMPRCANCGTGRVFEVQLTPHAIMELEREEMSLDGMEWGTIIVGVCEKDCQSQYVSFGDVGYVEEFAGVQWEEMKT